MFRKFNLCYFLLLLFIFLIPANYTSAQDYSDLTPETEIRMYIDTIKNSENTEEILKTIYKLSEIASEKAVEDLKVFALNKKNLQMKKMCIYALGRTHTKKSSEALEEIINNESIKTEPELINQCLYSIAEIERDNKIDLYMNYLKHETESVKITTIDILARFRNDYISESLIDIIENETNENIIEQAILSLGKQGSYNNLGFLKNHFETMENNKLKNATAVSIYKIEYLYRIKTDTDIINYVRNYYEISKNIEKLKAACMLLLTNDRFPLRILKDMYKDEDLTISEKKIIIKALIESPVNHNFTNIYNVLSSNNYELITYIHNNIFLMDTNNLVEQILNKKEYYEMFSYILKYKLKTNTELEILILGEYLKEYNISDFQPVIDIILLLDNETSILYLSNFLDKNSNLMKINTLSIINQINSNDAVTIVENEIINFDSDLKIRLFRNIQNTPNHRNLQLFYSHITSENQKLRFQAFDSFIKSNEILINKLYELYYDTLGRSSEEIISLQENINQHGIIPLYALFFMQDGDKNLEGKYIEYEEYADKLREIDYYMIKEYVTRGTIKLLSGQITRLLNDYKIRVFKDSEIFNNLYFIFIEPLLTNIFITRKNDPKLKQLFIPHLSKINSDFDSNYDVRKYIFDGMKISKKDIILTTAENLVYIYRTLYKPVDENKLPQFRKILRNRIIKTTEYLQYYTELKTIEANNKTDFEKKFSEEELEIIIVSLERALAEAVIIDRILCMDLLQSDIDSSIKKLLIKRMRVIADYEDVQDILINIANKQESLIRYEAMLILSNNIEKPDILKLFLERLADTSDEIRNLAVNKLAKLGKRVIIYIINNLESDDELLIQSSIKVLSLIGDVAMFDIRKALKNLNTEQKLNIINSLENLDDDFVGQIISIFSDDDNTEIKEATSGLLLKYASKNNDTEALFEAIEYLNTDKLTNIKETNNEVINKSVEILIKSLSSYDKKVYEEAVNRLVKIGIFASEEIISYLTNNNYRIRKGIETAVYRIALDNPSIINQLITSVKINDSNLTQSAINILNNLGDGIFDIVIDYIFYDDDNIKQVLVNYFTEIESENSLYPLIVLLNDDDYGISVTAEKALIDKFELSKNDIKKLKTLNEEELQKLENITLNKLINTILRG